MNLFFIYDVTFCKTEEDDPKDAIIYFFHSKATENEFYLLCCQLVGVAKFLKNTFSAPSVIALDQGKYVFHWSGKYLMVLGGSSDVQAKVLQDQLSFLCGIFCFYHGSLNNMLKACKYDRRAFLTKLELAWSRYINLSQCFGNILQFSMNALPLTAFKKSTGLVLKANRLLQMCQMSSSVMAGVVYYNSRVLASQLTPQLTNFLSLLSNYNASTPVNNATTEKNNLPPDVELKHIYLSTNVISKILKYNHSVVGSRIRVKSTNKTFSKPFSLPTFYEHLNSGSEGDVDSGNCSESAPTTTVKYHSVFSPEVKANLVLWPNLNSSNKNSRMVSCCVGHWRLLRRKLLKGRNQSCLKFIYEAVPVVEKLETADAEDSGFHPKNEVRSKSLCKANQEYQGMNLLCLNHVNLKTLSFISNSKEKHSNIKSANDLEFNCTLCSDRMCSINPLSIKLWNSEEDITCSKICSVSGYRTSIGSRSEKRKHSGSIRRTKIQVLKCRTNSESSTSYKTKFQFPSTSFHRKHSYDSFNFNSDKSSSYNSSSNSSEIYADIESNELQKHVVYVHRYGGSTLLLLFNKGYDEEIITYLWNCGFSILRDIEYCAEKITLSSLYVDPAFYIMLYNGSQKVLKEYPYYPSVLVTEKRVRNAVQSLQADFQQDPCVHSFHLLSAYQSIYASHKDQYFTFYIQPENNSRKIDTLSNLSKKAIKRLEKVFKISQ